MPASCIDAGNLRRDWSRKLPTYFRYGVQHVWFVDIRAQELHLLDRRGAQKHAGNVVISPPPFDVPLDLGRFWQRLQTQH